MANRRDMMALLGAALFAGGALEAKTAEIADAVVESDKAELRETPAGDQRIFCNGSTEQLEMIEVGNLLLNPGMTPHPPHQHPEEEIMIITEGSGEISLNGKTLPCNPGSVMYCEAGHLHGIVNTGKVPLLFYYFKWKKA